jgi:hypothetical protein
MTRHAPAQGRVVILMALFLVTPGALAQNSALSPNPAPQGGTKVITVWKVGKPFLRSEVRVCCVSLRFLVVSALPDHLTRRAPADESARAQHPFPKGEAVGFL